MEFLNISVGLLYGHLYAYVNRVGTVSVLMEGFFIPMCKGVTVDNLGFKWL